MRIKPSGYATWLVLAMGALLRPALLSAQNPVIIDHRHADLSKVPANWIDQAKTALRIAYQHTSHGSQIVTGLQALSAALGAPYTLALTSSGYRAGVFFNDYGISGASDLGNPNYTAWSTATRNLLARTGGCDRNVVVWSWCGQADTTAANIDLYLNQMNQLERDFPAVRFIYMTGHLNGTGPNGNLNQRNEQIRAFCRTQNKILFDFADIESYDPSGNGFLDRGANDGCNYSGGNWAQQWLAAHPGDPLAQIVAACGGCAHSERLNCVLKGRAFWWLLARLAGWPGPESGATISVSPSRLNFGTLNPLLKTSDQDVRLGVTGSGPVSWTASSSADWLSCDPGAGSGNALLHLAVTPEGLPPGIYRANVTISSPEASNSPVVLPVTLKAISSDNVNAAFGFMDTPPEGASGISGSVPVTGWALHDIQVGKVEIWRDPLSGEAANGLVYIGDAVFIEGARADVEAAFPDYPLQQRAGWGYMMLTNFLPNGGNGSFRIHAFAQALNGTRTLLGSRTIGCDNANASRPFGTIDTPAQGGTASGGAYLNFAWALTPPPYRIPTDGSTLVVWIDGEPQPERPSYNHYRSDIATLFPGYANSGGAVGFSALDTTSLSNGVHSLAWSVIDDGGRTNGIGSRFFTVMNSSSAIAGIEGWEGFSPAEISILEKIPVAAAPAFIKSGYDPGAATEAIVAGPDKKIEVVVGETGRFELNLDAEAFDPAARLRPRRFFGALVAGAGLQPLPTGSRLDTQRGIFTWQPGPGFLGTYAFVFLERSAGRLSKRLVEVKVVPKTR